MNEVGFVTKVRDFLVYLDGLPTIRINDMVHSDPDWGGPQVRGWVSAILPDAVEVLLLDDGAVKPGQMFKRMEERLTVAVGGHLLGRAVNPLGIPIDGKGPLLSTRTTAKSELDRTASGIQARQFITEQFISGVSIVDSLIPLGKGQRELVLGDARSGKTSFLIDLIVNQAGSGVVCIYASIGKPITEVRSLIDILKANQALAHTIVIAASSTDTAPLIYLAPQTAFSVAEYFQQKGKDVLLILDDMGNHAKIYREIALLGNKAPGRESYPGDIFYAHAHLLERAGKFGPKEGGGSITAIPVIELNLNDFTTFIPTNLMAMTDGHLLFKSALYNSGQRPAIDIPLSVSRIGQQTQSKAQNLLATRVKQVLARSLSLETISRFSTELPEATQQVLHQASLIHEMLKQESLTKVSPQVQTLLLGLVFTSFLRSHDVAYLRANKQKLVEAFEKDPTLLALTGTVFSLKDDEEIIEKLEEVVKLVKLD